MLHRIDLSRVDLNLLVLFEAVLAERHVGRAAERLSLSPSAVSHGLSRLRRMLSDPLFLKTPKGVVPTERALALAPAIARVLEEVRAVLDRAEPFDPARSERRLLVGAPDGVSAVFLQPLLADLAANAPGIALGIRQLLPLTTEVEPERAWRGAFAELEARTLDVAVVPVEEGPARFARRLLYRDDFVLVMRPGHAFAGDPSLAHYCASDHLVVSHSGDRHGFVDEVLARRGLARRVALTVPNFMFACAILAGSELVCAVPRRFAEGYGPRLGLAVVEPPIPLGAFDLNAFVPRAALMDAGLAWLLDRLAAAAAASLTPGPAPCAPARPAPRS